MRIICRCDMESLACDVTVVSPLHATGEARPRAAGVDGVDGVAIADAEDRKYTKYPELLRSQRCQLIVLACEVGGRWSDTCCWLIRELSEWRNRNVLSRLRHSTARAWEARWWSMLCYPSQCRTRWPPPWWTTLHIFCMAGMAPGLLSASFSTAKPRL